MLLPPSPSGIAQPKITSSISAPSIPARAIAWRMAWPPRVPLWVLLKAPRKAFASGVRAVETTTASVIWLFLDLANNAGPRRYRSEILTEGESFSGTDPPLASRKPGWR